MTTTAIHFLPHRKKLENGGGRVQARRYMKSYRLSLTHMCVHCKGAVSAMRRAAAPAAAGSYVRRSGIKSGRLSAIFGNDLHCTALATPTRSLPEGCAIFARPFSSKWSRGPKPGTEEFEVTAQAQAPHCFCSYLFCSSLLCERWCYAAQGASNNDTHSSLSVASLPSK